MSKSSAGRKLVIVESPTKAKTIRKFLGKEFTVESCMGHVRDLPQSAKDIPEKFKKEKWANLGVNVNDDFDPIYCVPRTKTRIVKTLKDKLSEADELILATDEDREGESISWHLLEILRPKIPVKRMVFHEITKEAIQNALNQFRDIDDNLVRAQEARRILDRLVGYSISPLLWKKVTYGLSAGRVQSVAVRLIAEREHERLRFKKSHYWNLTAKNEKDGVGFESRSFTLSGKRVASGKDFDEHTGLLLADRATTTTWLKEDEARAWQKRLTGKEWTVTEVEEKPISRKPAAPFITSTLQQESNRKLGFTSRETMELAQKLYERGFITYMRTDSPGLSTQAIEAARAAITELYGKSYLPPGPREYSAKKSKGAQEAHEAIRPAGTRFQNPEETGLTGGLLRVYELIWKRTVASQMTNAEQKLLSAKFKVDDAVFSTSGLTIEFPGFLKVYVEENDDDQSAAETRLPKLKVGDKVQCRGIEAVDHETKPPARFTEASLVQTMEREGIGRPSTYATIISTIQDRGYVRKAGNALVPTFTALVVSKLLKEALPNYVDLNFTSAMERSLDKVAQGDMDYVKYLASIYFGDDGLKSQIETQDKAINAETSRSIKLEGLENLSFRIGKYGAYVCRTEASGEKEVCASLPDAQVPGDITAEIANKLIDQKINGTDALGKDPVSGLPVYVLTGRYGPYTQLGDNDSEKLKRMAIPNGMEPENIKLEDALKLLELPKALGPHPDSGKDIKKGLGRFGPYVVHDGDYRSIPRTDHIFDVDIKRALELFAQPKRLRGRAAPLKELGLFPDTQEPVQVFAGKFGTYLKVGARNISVHDDRKVEDLTLDAVLGLIRDKIALGPVKGKGKPTRRAPAKTAKAGKAAPKPAKAKVAATKAAPATKIKIKKAATSTAT